MRRLVLGACLAAALLTVATVVPAQAAQPTPTDPTNRAVDRSADEPVPDQYIVTLRDDRTSPESLGQQYGADVQLVYEDALDGFSARMSTAEADAMVDDPRVAAVEQDGGVHVSTEQPSPPAPWGLDRIDERDLPLDAAYSYNATAPSVHAYILDTGIRTTHTDFGGRASIGFDAIGGSNPTGDCHGHGTHVAGTVGGSTYGVVKDVTLVAVRVLDCNGDGTWAQVIAGVDWVTANAGTHAVANMSLSGSASSAADSAIANSIASGVTYAVAAGNNNGASACGFSPSRVPNALTVAATDITDTRASFSNIGTCVDLFAPGVGIFSASNADDSSSTSKSGTSMASPHVAGTAALYLSHNPTAAPSEVAAAIVGTAITNHVTNAGAGSPNLLDYTTCVDTPTTVPGAPVGVSASAGDEMAVVTWSPPTGADCPASLVTGYTVTSSPDGKTCTGSPAVLTCPVLELTNDTAYTFTVTATNGAGPGLDSDPSAPVTPSAAAGTFTSLPPARILDTRDGTGLSGVFTPNQIRDLTVTGVGGVPSTGVDAVVMNVAVTQPTAAGHLTLFPAGAPLPNAANLNFVAGQTVPNLVVVKVGDGAANEGRVSIANTVIPGGSQPAAGSVHVIADVVGWYSDGSTSPAARFTGLVPNRILDTRSDVGLADAFAANESRVLQVTGVGVPVGADAVVMNVAVTNPSAPGHLTLHPADQSLPNASNLNFTAGLTVANLAVVKLSNNGEVAIANTLLPSAPQPAAGTVDVIADVVGYFASAPDSSLTSIAPVRVLDTRTGTGVPVAPNGTITVDPRVGTGLPPAGSYSAVVVNVTATGPTQIGHLTVYPSDGTLPLASNLNFAAGKTVPNLVETKVGVDGRFSIANTRVPDDPQPSSGTVHVVVDIVGYYT